MAGTAGQECRPNWRKHCKPEIDTCAAWAAAAEQRLQRGRRDDYSGDAPSTSWMRSRKVSPSERWTRAYAWAPPSAKPILTAPCRPAGGVLRLWERVLKRHRRTSGRVKTDDHHPGRGGSGFPMGLKWELREHARRPEDIVATPTRATRRVQRPLPHWSSAAPGALRHDGGRLLHQCRPPACSTSAKYPEGGGIVKQAVKRTWRRRAGWTGDIQGSSFNFRFKVIRGRRRLCVRRKRPPC